MRYRILLFDVDNTLLDFDANEEESFRSLVEEMGETFTEEMYETYKKMNRELWKKIEKNEITVDEGVNRRFSDLMSFYGKTVDGRQWERTYRSFMNQGIQEIPEVHQVLKKLQEEGYDLYVITNGVEETQMSRMSRSGLSRYFKELFISGRIGAGKPSCEFFDYVKSHIPGFHEKEALVIGDSLSSDIKGGAIAGIDTCWFTREGEESLREEQIKECGVKPNYVIGTLAEIFDILSDK